MRIVFKKLPRCLKTVLFGFSIVIIFNFGTYEPALGELKVDITRGTVKPLPIAITNFIGETQQEIELGQSISNVIEMDLERSGLFKSIGILCSSLIRFIQVLNICSLGLPVVLFCFNLS